MVYWVWQTAYMERFSCSDIYCYCAPDACRVSAYDPLPCNWLCNCPQITSKFPVSVVNLTHPSQSFQYSVMRASSTQSLISWWLNQLHLRIYMAWWACCTRLRYCWSVPVDICESLALKTALLKQRCLVSRLWTLCWKAPIMSDRSKAYQLFQMSSLPCCGRAPGCGSRSIDVR